MAVDYQSAWISKTLNPLNLFRSMFTDYDRSNALSDVFNERLFFNAHFRNLEGNLGWRRHLLIVNASRLHQSAARSLFSFTEKAFKDIDSNLASYRISDAVAASAAFPAAVDSATLRNFTTSGYVHLADGGLVDNVGEKALYESALYHFTTHTARKDKGCLLIFADAYVEPREPIDMLRDTRHSILDHLINPNVYDAFDLLLSTRRDEQRILSGFSPYS